jgi:hypothetical protein
MFKDVTAGGVSTFEPWNVPEAANQAHMGMQYGRLTSTSLVGLRFLARGMQSIITDENPALSGTKSSLTRIDGHKSRWGHKSPAGHKYLAPVRLCFLLAATLASVLLRQRWHTHRTAGAYWSGKGRDQYAVR